MKNQTVFTTFTLKADPDSSARQSTSEPLPDAYQRRHRRAGRLLPTACIVACCLCHPSLSPAAAPAEKTGQEPPGLTWAIPDLPTINFFGSKNQENHTPPTAAAPRVPGLTSLLVNPRSKGIDKIYAFIERMRTEHDAKTIFGAETIPIKKHLREQWGTVIKKIPTMAPDEKLRVINGFFNRWRSASDAATYGASEYWALPWEFFEKDQGDCEDYAIVKYLALRHFSWPAEDMWILLVQNRKKKDFHAVLMVSNKDALVILDNLSKPFHLLIPSHKYFDRFKPLFGVNEHGVWMLKAEGDDDSMFILPNNDDEEEQGLKQKLRQARQLLKGDASGS